MNDVVWRTGDQEPLATWLGKYSIENRVLGKLKFELVQLFREAALPRSRTNSAGAWHSRDQPDSIIDGGMDVAEQLKDDSTLLGWSI